jgi:hypothetical protein
MATNTPAVFFRGNPAYGTTNVQRVQLQLRLSHLTLLL